MPSPASPPSAFPPPPPPATAAADPLVHYVRSSPPSAWVGALTTAAGLLSTATTTLGAAAGRALLWAGRSLGRLLAWVLARTFAAAAWPARRALALLRFLLSPVTYTVAYAVAPVGYLVRFLGQFRPLYTFLGAAAFIGIVTGLVLKLFFTAMWPDADDDNDAYGFGTTDDRRLSSTSEKVSPLPGPASARRPALPARPAASKNGTSGLDGQPDDVWSWLQEFNPPAPAVATTDAERAGDGGGGSAPAPAHALLPNQKPRPGGLLSLTIMEESSTE